VQINFPPNIQEQIDRAAQDNSVSKQKKLLEIVESYFSSSVEDAPTPSLIAFDIIMQNQALREQLRQLQINYEWLRGEYALAIIKLLPAAEKTMKPWWTRLFRR
jgi:hypothetical protein